MRTGLLISAANERLLRAASDGSAILSRCLESRTSLNDIFTPPKKKRAPVTW
jgi:hypothetical protein